MIAIKSIGLDSKNLVYVSRDKEDIKPAWLDLEVYKNMYILS